jgi:LmbE family N-acetylglucosaminyl deacetylase
MTMRLGLGNGAGLRILCLGAHCDDIEIGCGGTILTLTNASTDIAVHWVVFSANDEREREARRCASMFLDEARESTIVVNRFRDGYFPYEGAVIKDYFEELKEQISPDIIFTHHGRDGHQDHRLISELTWNTFRGHLILEYEIPKYDGDLGAPSVFAPLAPAIAEEKLRYVLECYKSQSGRHWFSRDVFMGLMRLRAMEANAGVEHAEAFYGRKLVLAVTGAREACLT